MNEFKLRAIHHRRPSVTFDSDGITIHPRFFRAASIPWHEIKYISPTPEYELVDGTWIPRATPDFLLSSGQDPTQALVDSGDLELKLATSARFVPMWMLFPFGSISAKPLYDADDRPCPSSRVIFLQLNTAKLSAPAAALFKLQSEYSRVDLIVID